MAQWDQHNRNPQWYYAEYLHSLGIINTPLQKDDPRIPKRPILFEYGIKQICLITENTNYDYLEMRCASDKSGIHYTYPALVFVKIGENDKDLDANHSSMISALWDRTPDKFYWKGGRLADALNADYSLNDMLFQTDNTIFHVKAFPKYQYVEISSGIFSHYPNPAYFEAINRIAGHIRMLAPMRPEGYHK